MKVFATCVEKIDDFLFGIQYVRSRVKVKTAVFKVESGTCICVVVKKKKTKKWQTMSVTVVKIQNEIDLEYVDGTLHAYGEVIRGLYCSD